MPLNEYGEKLDSNGYAPSILHDIFSPSMGMRMALVILGGAPVRTSPLKF